MLCYYNPSYQHCHLNLSLKLSLIRNYYIPSKIILSFMSLDVLIVIPNYLDLNNMHKLQFCYVKNTAFSYYNPHDKGHKCLSPVVNMVDYITTP